MWFLIKAWLWFDVPGPSSPQSPTWAAIEKGTKRLSLPFYDPPDADLPLSSFFSLLAEPDTTDSVPPQLAHRTIMAKPASRKRHAPVTSTSSSGSPSPTAPGSKRPRLSPADSETSVSAPASFFTCWCAGFGPGAQSSIPPTATSLLTIGHHLSSKLAVYNDNLGTVQPENLIVGDSIVRLWRLPGAITYCLSEG